MCGKTIVWITAVVGVAVIGGRVLRFLHFQNRSSALRVGLRMKVAWELPPRSATWMRRRIPRRRWGVGVGLSHGSWRGHTPKMGKYHAGLTITIYEMSYDLGADGVLLDWKGSGERWAVFSEAIPA